MDIWSKYTQRYRDEGNKIVWSDFEQLVLWLARMVAGHG
jgi:hypothetical protein